jgi:hypothetical protein
MNGKSRVLKVWRIELGKSNCAVKKRSLGKEELEINYGLLYHLVQPTRAPPIAHNHAPPPCCYNQSSAEAASEFRVPGSHRDARSMPPRLQLYRCL